MSKVNPKAIMVALANHVDGVELDILAKHLGLERKRRRWWFDESSAALRRRCEIVFVERYALTSLVVP